MKNFSCVILAAGKGTRMKSDRPKVLMPVLGKPMLDWVIDAAKEAGAASVCVVAGHMEELVRAHTGARADIAVQREQLGTGHAVMMAADFIENNRGGAVIVLSGDTPLITGDTIAALFNAHTEQGNAATVLTARLPDPTGYGRIIRGADGSVEKIVEHRDATPEQIKIDEINSGIYCFEPGALLSALDGLGTDNAQGEYYLTDTLSIIKGGGGRVGALTASDFEEITGVNDRIQLNAATAAAKERIAKKLMLSGVTVCDINSTEISPECVISPDVTIMPATILRGRCVIGPGCVIGPSTQLTDVTVGENTTVNQSVALKCTIGSNTSVGPFAYIRPDSAVGDRVKVGDFVEVKNSSIGDGTKISHLTYVGDSDVGENVNFGCGTVTVNYDGKKKHRTTIGDNAFIGCNTNLIAPVRVGDDAYTAAGSTITEDVPSGALAIARERQVNIKGWVKKREVEKK